jgi:histone chaperone ASF1
LQADPPDVTKIPADDAVGVTVVLITASYRDQEFVRVGYYVNNEYEDPELKDNPPIEPMFDKLVRTIATDQPRVTKFKINWESEAAAAANGAAAANSGETATTADAPTNYYNGQDAEMSCEDNMAMKPNIM